MVFYFSCTVNFCSLVSLARLVVLLSSSGSTLLQVPCHFCKAVKVLYEGCFMDCSLIDNAAKDSTLDIFHAIENS